jgi:hypothetical protein
VDNRKSMKNKWNYQKLLLEIYIEKIRRITIIIKIIKIKEY